MSSNPSSGTPAERLWATRLLLWLLGAWLVLTVAMGFLASGNFRVLDPDRLRNADTVYQEIPAGEERRQDLRYAASELNRYYFRIYSVVHLLIAGAALLLWGLSRRRSRLALAALSVSFVMALLFFWWLTPELTKLGREIDFMARDPEPPEVARFYQIHRINVSLELAKMAMLVGVAAHLIRR